MKGRFKKWMGFAHLWLGLLSGTVIFIVCLTAAIWAFSPEIENIAQSYRHVQPQEKPFLKVSELKKICDTLIPGKPLRRLTYHKTGLAAEAGYYGSDYYYIAFVNPYTGEVLKVKDENRAFFRVVLTGHMSLWMGTVGEQIVRWSTLIFLVMLISGIVLWWPKNKAARKQRYKIKFGTSPKRLNYDLHNVLGFYGSWALIFAVLTGLVWTFDSVAKSEYWLASGGASMPAYPSPVVNPGPGGRNGTGLDSIFLARVSEHGQLGGLSAAMLGTEHEAGLREELAGAAVSFDERDSAAVQISIYPEEQYYSADHYYYNPYTLKEIPVNFYGKYRKANAGEKLSRMNYDIHIGNILGLPGRAAMFLGVLIGASLPVTGFYIWLGRRRKKPRRVSPPDQSRRISSVKPIDVPTSGVLRT